MSSYFKEDELSNARIDLGKRNYRFAFSVERVFGTPVKQKSDPEFVKFLVGMYGYRNGEEFLRRVPFHKCTDEDYDQFYPVKRQSADLLKEIREDPERGLFCIDWNNEDEPIEIAG